MYVKLKESVYIKAIRFEPASRVSSSGISDAGGGSDPPDEKDLTRDPYVGFTSEESV